MLKKVLGEYMLKKVFCLFKVVVIFYLLYCLEKGMLTTAFICLFNLILFFVADIIQKKIGYSDFFNLLIYLFLFGSLTLAKTYSLFNSVWYFDIIIHVLSSFIVSGLLFYVIRYFNVNINSFFLTIFIFSFAMMIASLWEITEFGIDRMFNSDMQKDTIVNEVKSVLLSSDGKSVVKKNVNTMSIGDTLFNGYVDIGLYDTIEDMICAVGGSLLFIVVERLKGYTS